MLWQLVKIWGWKKNCGIRVAKIEQLKNYSYSLPYKDSYYVLTCEYVAEPIHACRKEKIREEKYD